MEQSTEIAPRLIVVTGRPGSGKTTLAHALARAIRCPAICRDEIKEGFVNTIGPLAQLSDDINRNVYDVFFDTITLLLSRGITLVAEAAFQHKNWAPKLEPLRAVARIRIVICSIDPQIARARHIERGLADPQRERFHDDAVVQAAREGRALPIDVYDPPHLDLPSLTVDTSQGYQPSLDQIISFSQS
ncbi:MAG: ATP-binding protein [Anaerolineae bacterium]|nr:ATP-binding protein [Phycisphaerae bacterium]